MACNPYSNDQLAVIRECLNTGVIGKAAFARISEASGPVHSPKAIEMKMLHLRRMTSDEMIAATSPVPDRGLYGTPAWNSAKMAQLRDLWLEGLSTQAIGDRMRISKNAVIGKARTLKLPSRPSPIKKVEGAPQRIRRLRTNTLPELAVAPMVIIPAEEKFVQTKPPANAVASSPRHQCEWLEGARKPYVRCENAVKPGKSWCKDHYRVVFIRTPSRQDGGHDFTFARKTF